MLNIGMTELLCFAIIALLVLGPEKLPEGARFVAKWYGKFKRLISSVQSEIDRELRLSEFRDEVQKEIERIGELERRMQQQIDALRSQHTEPKSSDTLPPIVQEKVYQHLKIDTITPFSSSHIQHYLNCMPPALEVKKLTHNLKIAV